MAKVVVGAEVQVSTSGAEGSVKSLKQQLREAQSDVATLSEKFGATSQAAIEAAKRAANLKDAIGDAKALTDAFNPDRKFSAFAGALQGVVGGFTAVQGAMALMGAESEDVQKTLLKVQSAMAMVQGLNAINESIESFQRLGTYLKSFTIVQKAVTAAQWLWNAAMAANPIGAIIVAITALIAGIVALTSWLKASSDAAKEQTKAIQENEKAVEKQKDAIDKANLAFETRQKHSLAMLKASGASAEAIRKHELALINEKIAFREATAATALNTLEKQKNYLATLKSNDADDEKIKQQQKVVDKSREQLKTANQDILKAGQERIELINKQKEEVLQEQTDAHKKELEKQKAHNEKLKEQQKKNAEDIKAANKKAGEDILKTQEEITLLRIKDDRKRAELKLEMDLEAAKKEVDNSKASAENKAKLIQELETKYMLDLQALKDKNAEEDKKKEEQRNNERNEALKSLNDTRIAAISDNYIKAQELEALRYQDEIDRNLALLNDKKITQEEYNAWRENAEIIHSQNLQQINKDNAEAQKKIDEEAFNARQEQIGRITGLLNNFAEIAGKNTAAGKALSVAGAVIDTYSAANKVLASSSPAFIANPYLRFASAAATIATGLMNVKKILSVQVPKGGGAGGSAPSGVSPVTAPIAPQIGGTQLNQNQVNQLSSATARAFVLESDVSGNQERIRRLNRAARIN